MLKSLIAAVGIIAMGVVPALAVDFTWSPPAPEIGEMVVFTVTGVPAVDSASWTFGEAGCSGYPDAYVCTPLYTDCMAYGHKFAGEGDVSVTLEVVVDGATLPAVAHTVTVSDSGSCDGGGGGGGGGGGLGSIRGQVRDRVSGEPVTGGWLRLYDGDGTNQGSAVALDANGEFVMTPLSAGVHFVVVTHVSEPYIRQLYDDIPCPPAGSATCAVTTGTEVVVPEDGSDVTGIDFLLDRGGTIDVEISLADSPTVMEAAADVFDDSGAFVMRIWQDFNGGNVSPGGLPPGTYHAVASETAVGLYTPELFDDIPCVGIGGACDVTAGTPIPVTAWTSAPMAATLARGGVVRGTVTDRTYSLPVSGATVELFDHHGFPVGEDATDSEGRYRIPVGLPSGLYLVRAGKAGYHATLYPNLMAPPLEPGCGPCDVLDGGLAAVTTPDTSWIDLELSSEDCLFWDGFETGHPGQWSP